MIKRFRDSLNEVTDPKVAIYFEEMIDRLTEEIFTHRTNSYRITRQDARNRATEFFARCVERGANETWELR